VHRVPSIRKAPAKLIPTFSLLLRETRWNPAEAVDEKPDGGAVHGRAGHPGRNYDIFEGTEQIQQLVISRAISGLRIE
jgi:hypothetical protein